jgi:hypothetical protein
MPTPTHESEKTRTRNERDKREREKREQDKRREKREREKTKQYTFIAVKMVRTKEFIPVMNEYYYPLLSLLLRYLHSSLACRNS